MRPYAAFRCASPDPKSCARSGNRFTSLPFREREIGATVDCSKVSQLMTAHAKEVEYNNHDKRPGAD